MPTPFTHLFIAQRLLEDDAIPEWQRRLLSAETGAFLCGNIAPDAQSIAGLPRDHTHFYGYAQDLGGAAPWRVMLSHFGELWKPRTLAHQSFIAGYITHLSIDEIWSREMVAPHFFGREWADLSKRYIMLHVILIYMDERDQSQLADWHASRIHPVSPERWLPFLPDNALNDWKALIYQQLKPGGKSETLNIYSRRVKMSPDALRTLLDSEEEMERKLWLNISHTLLHAVEESMYEYARDQLIAYLNGSSTSSGAVD